MKKTFLIFVITIITLNAVVSQGRKAPSQNFSNFRGQRKSFDIEENLTITHIDFTDVDNGIKVDIQFSEPVEPQSLNSRTIFINSKPLDSNTKITFNRDGTRAQFVLNRASGFRIEFNGIKSFSNKRLEPTEVLVD